MDGKNFLKSRILMLICKFLQALLVLTGITACSPTNPAELYGNYAGHYKGMNATLNLHSNYTYDQQLASGSSNKIHKTHGQWNYDFQDSSINFDKHFIDVDPLTSQPIARQIDGYTHMPTTVIFGHAFLGDDVPQYFSNRIVYEKA